MKQVDELKKFCRVYTKIYIYGAGEIARELSGVMNALNCKYEAYIVTKKDNNIRILYGHRVLGVTEVNLATEGIGVILGVSHDNQKEIKNMFDEMKIKNYFLYKKDNSFYTEVLSIISLTERVRFLKDAIKNNMYISVIISSSIGCNNTNWRYRAYNICQVMRNSSDNWRYVFFSENEIEDIIPFLDQIDIITLLRLQWTFELDAFIKQAKCRNTIILYSVDDLVFTQSHAVRILKNHTGRCTLNLYNTICGKIMRNRLLMEMADGFLSTNTYLSESLKTEFHKPCQLIRNFINDEQREISNTIIPSYSVIKKIFTIGYFSGTFTHQQDFSCCSLALSRLLDKYENINLRIVGYIKMPKELESYQQEGRIEELPSVDFLTLQKLIGEVDVNLAPLVIDEFTNAKSELKFFEAAIMSVPTCASPTTAFRECIENGKNGFLCNTDEEWYSSIECLYLNFELRKEMALQAKDYALKNYTGDEIVKMITAAYTFWMMR